MIELYKDINGFEGLYKISNIGNVYSCKKEIIMKTRFDKDGYKQINLYKNGKNYTLKIHRLVANAFIENKYNKPQVNHKDGNKANNRVDNLEWCTNYENRRHAVENSLHHVLFTKEIFDLIEHRKSKGERYSDICKELNLNVNTFYAHKKHYTNLYNNKLRGINVG